MRFLVDEMLFDVAKYIRFMGYDVLVLPSGSPDDELLEDAKREGRVLITADKALYQKAAKLGIETVFVNIRNTLNEKLLAVVCGLNLHFREDRTRCTKCGGKLINVKEAQVPDSVRKLYFEFQKCVNCKHIFWKGSHWKAMRERIKKIEESCKKPQDPVP